LLDAAKGCLVFQNTGLEVYSEPERNPYSHRLVTAAAFNLLTARKRKLQVFTASLTDINKALAEKKYTDPRTKLPSWIDPELYLVFDRKDANKLPPHREGVDHGIKLLRAPNGLEQIVL